MSRPTIAGFRQSWAIGPAEPPPVRRPGRREDIYKGAQVNRLYAEWMASCMSPDDELRGSLRTLRARARELARNNSWVKQYLRLLTNNVIGPKGMGLAALVRGVDGSRDRKTNRAIELAWRRWAKKPVTVDQKLNLSRLERLLLRTMAIDGEAFVRIWRGFKGNPFAIALQPIDADLIDDTFNRLPKGGLNEIRMGVEIDALGAPIAYHVWNQPPGGYYATMPRLRYRVLADEMIHLYDPERMNQTRGVTWITSGMVPIKMLGGYEEAELVAARTGAAKIGVIQQMKGSDPMDLGDDNSVPAEMEANPGSIEKLPPGWEFVSWDPDHPSVAFPAFVKQMLRSFSAATGTAYNDLASDLEGVSYSAMRSGVLVSRDFWRVGQDLWISLFRDPLTPEWLNFALLSGKLVLSSVLAEDYVEAVEHRARGWEWPDPLKDGAAGKLAIETGLDTRTRLLAERGLDVEEVFEELAEEQRLAKELGISIMATPTTSVVTSSTDDDDEEEEDDEDKKGDDDAARSNGHRRPRNRVRERLHS